MSQCRYYATFNNVEKVYAKLNSIQTVVCDYEFIVNELGEKIGFDDFDLDFHQFDYIVTTTQPECHFLKKGNYTTSITEIKFSAAIKCSEVELSEVQHLICRAPLSPYNLELEPKKSLAPYNLFLNGSISNFDSHLTEVVSAGQDTILSLIHI